MKTSVEIKAEKSAASSAPRWWHVQQLEAQGCTADDWNAVTIEEGTDLRLLRNVDFIGSNHVGLLDREKWPGCMLKNLTAENCSFGKGVRICNVSGILKNVKVGDEAVIENVGRIEYEPEATCGIGQQVAVLDETGSRPVAIYPGLSAQTAALM